MNDTASKVIVRATDIEQIFKVGDEMLQVLFSTNFTIRENTFNTIFGPSGSGKSTLLNILSGLQPPTRGEVTFDGRNVYKLSSNELAHFRANQIGIVYQQNFWVKSLTVIENISLPLFFLGYSRAQAAKSAMNALERINMGAYAKKYPLFLSGGEQQRVAMARAIVNDPRYIIADEPTGSLDSKNGDMIMSLLQSYQKDLNRTIILVTHNMEYLPLADNLLRVQDGHVEEMQSDDIRQTTERLIREMKDRIDELAEKKTHAG